MLSNLLSEELSDGKPFVFRAGTHDSNSTSVLCFTPKSGSSAWKALLVRALVLQGFSTMNDKRSAHGQKLPYKISRVDTLLTDIYIPKLMFVRHPISRLLSYLGKGRTGKIGSPDGTAALAFTALCTPSPMQRTTFWIRTGSFRQNSAASARTFHTVFFASRSWGTGIVVLSANSTCRKPCRAHCSRVR